MPELDYLFNPKSVALIGASATPGKWGNRFATLLISSGYGGKIFPINPKGGELQGYPIYRSIEEIGEPVDLAIIIVGVEHAPKMVASCAENGVKVTILFTAGFGEVDESRSQVEREMVEKARKHGMRLVGPNCMSVFSSSAGMNLTGWTEIPHGNIGLVCQSGNIALTLWYEAVKYWGLGFSKFIGYGNQSDVAVHEYIEYLKDDPDTHVIILYLEGLQQNMGGRFVQAARETTRIKPIVALKGGRTTDGSRAARSHTGSLAGEPKLYSAAMRQAGIIEVDRFDELLPVAETLMRCPPLTSKNMALVGSGGGHSIVVADTIGQYGLTAPRFDDSIIDKISSYLPYWAPASNPIDMTGAFTSDQTLWATLTRIAFQDPQGIGGAFVFGVFGGGRESTDKKAEDPWVTASRHLVKQQKASGKPIILYSPYARENLECFRVLRQGGIPVYDSIEIAGRCFRALWDYGDMTGDDSDASMEEVRTDDYRFSTDGQRDEFFLKASRREERNMLEPEANGLLDSYGIDVVPYQYVRSHRELAEAGQRLGYPVVLKVVSPHIIHKSDVGGVVTNIKNEGDLITAYENILSSLGTDQDPEGFIVSKFVSKGKELIVGSYRDDQFGPTIMVGMGGIFVEAFNDTAFRILPVGEKDVQSMLQELKGYFLLHGYRGQEKLNVNGLVRLILRLCSMIQENTQITEVDLNPVFITEDEVLVADSRIILA